MLGSDNLVNRGASSATVSLAGSNGRVFAMRGTIPAT